MAKQLSRIEEEHSKLYGILNFRLHHRFKRLGLLGAIGILLFLIGYKFYGGNLLLAKDVLKTIMLLFLLIASLSKDELEDEYNKQIRYQSFVVAFVITAGYAIAIPLIALILNVLMTKITGDGSVSFYEISAFEVIFSLIGMQLLFFETLKRFGRA